MKDPKTYTPKDRAAVAELASLLTPFLKQVVPPIPSDPLVKSQAWRTYAGVHLHDPWEYSIDGTLTRPYIKAAVALEDLGMAFRETLTMNPLAHDCRYLTQIKNHEHIMIVAPSSPSAKAKQDEPDIAIVAFIGNQYQKFAGLRHKRVAALGYAYLLFRALEMDLVDNEFLRKLETIKKEDQYATDGS